MGTESYFGKGLESSVPAMSEGNGMPTVQNLSEVCRKSGVRGSTELDEQESTTNENKNHVEGVREGP